jgi:sugar diacid utilization regulator
MYSVERQKSAFTKGTIKAYSWKGDRPEDAHVAMVLGDGINVLATLCVTKLGAHFDQWDISLVSTLADVMLNFLQKHTLLELRHTRSVSFEHAFMPLFEEGKVNWNTFRHNAKQVGFSFSNYYILLMVDFSVPSKYSRYNIRTILEDALFTRNSMVVEDNLVFLLGFADEESANNWDRTAIQTLLSRYELYAATSRVFSDLKDVRRHFENTRHVLEHYYCGPQETRLLSAEDLGILFVVEALMKTGGLEDFLDPKILRLMNHDEKNHTSYMETLYAYLRNSQKPLLACKELHIHRNTLDYRLSRMEEMIHVDWNNGDETFRLFLSLSVIHYTKMIKSYQEGENAATEPIELQS